MSFLIIWLEKKSTVRTSLVFFSTCNFKAVLSLIPKWFIGFSMFWHMSAVHAFACLAALSVRYCKSTRLFSYVISDNANYWFSMDRLCWWAWSSSGFLENLWVRNSIHSSATGSGLEASSTSPILGTRSINYRSVVLVVLSLDWGCVWTGIPATFTPKFLRRLVSGFDDC